MKRRELLKLLALGAVMPVNGVLAGIKDKQRVLLMVELNGGNDSLNTVLPLTELEAYHALRPTLGLKVAERIELDSKFAIHSALLPLLPAWSAGELALVHGLGYPEPNRSHFRSIEIWDTASDADEYLQAGWLSGYIAGKGQKGIDGMVFGRNGAAFSGNQARFIQMQRIERFINEAKHIEAHSSGNRNHALDHVIRTQNTAQIGGESLLRRWKARTPFNMVFPDSRFGRQLEDIAQAIQLDLGIPAFKVALSGFDTHSNQRQRHENLLQALSEGLSAFRKALIASGHWSDVLVVTYSEFGRRAGENGSGGTDHGTAATHFVMGGRVKGGHIGAHPSLTSLVEGDMVYTTDFRGLYDTIVRKWWNTLPSDSSGPLSGSIAALDFVRR